jgi:uroporphyrinogen-III synthase
MARPLEHKKIALAEGRQLEELAQMLEQEGADTLRCPMLSIVDTPDEQGVLDWLGDLQRGRFGYVILMTGEALRRLMGFARRAGIDAAVVAALGKTQTITRGPKPVRALKEVGLAPTTIASSPTTEGVIDTLRTVSLSGETVGLTLYGEPNPRLEGFLEAAGATVRTVMPYLYAPRADGDQVGDLIRQLADGKVYTIIFTSSPQVDRLFEVAGERRSVEALQQGLERTKVAAVGPVVAENLRSRKVRVDICPEQGFVMKNLVQQLKREIGSAAERSGSEQGLQ